MTTNKRFVYDEKTSSLYAPDGTYLKKVFCPKALNWNQLTAGPGESRWKNCESCEEKVIDLDVADVDTVINECGNEWKSICIHASSKSNNVIFLKDKDAPPPATELELNEDGLPVIKTVRSIEDINRAVGLGYWPDVRLIEYDTSELSSKIAIGQDRETGKIDVSGDYRSGFGSSNSNESKWVEVIPFHTYYQYYQADPIAAYLIPCDMQDGTVVLVEDPIEDIVGWRWNQGNSGRAMSVKGHVEGRKVVLNKESVYVSEVMG